MKTRSIFRRDRFADALVAHLRRTRTTCVLDVGANTGQYGDYLRLLGCDGTVVSFEPVEASFRKLRERASADARWHVYQMALGEESGEFPIHILPRSDFNSFRTPNAFGLQNFKDITPESTETVVVKRLDEFLNGGDSDFDTSSIFLKTDTQGFDLEVIRGGGERRDDLNGIQAELSVVPIYSGVLPLDETLREYAHHGFVPIGFRPISWSEGVLVEMDGLFRNVVPPCMPEVRSERRETEAVPGSLGSRHQPG